MFYSLAIFIFILHMCVGGVLGINQTTGETFVFYYCNWNPSNNVQATYYQSHAHHLGQTHQVTVYQHLIMKGTINEHII